uniref:Uncharacterized protein n=1 Tax=Equus caballus TaxID=9796 RepID=A0A9L0SRI9_HORSE
MVQLLWIKYGNSSKKLKIELPYEPAVPFLGVYPKELKVGSPRDICAPMVTAALFTTAERWRQPIRPSTEEWINTMWYIHSMERDPVLQRK